MYVSSVALLTLFLLCLLASLQIPYLLSLAGLLSTFLPAFPFAPSPTFSITRKFDAAFAYLLQLPATSVTGSSKWSHGVSPTEKVRINSLISSTRVTAMDLARKGGYSTLVVADDDETDDNDEPEESTDEEEDESHDKVAIGLSKMYLHTLELLGDSLG